MGQPLVPPDFVNVPSGPTYDAGLPDPVFRTYVRLRGLAWKSRYRETPPLTIGEMMHICHHNERSMWGHLKALRSHGLLSWRTLRGQMVLKFPLLQTFAAPCGGAVVDEDPEKQQQQPPAPTLQTFAVEARVAAALQALAEYGVDAGEAAARDVAQLEHVTADLVRAWGEHLRGDPGCRNLPGLLLYKLRTNRQPPRAVERRGGARRPTGASDDERPAQAPLLPDTLHEQLAAIGFCGAGPLRELAAAWERGPERVQGWVDHVEREGLGGGFLLEAIRSGDVAPLAPEEIEERERRRRYARSLGYGGWPNTPSPAEIAPEPDPSVETKVGGGLTAEQLWQAALGELQLQMTQATFDTWLRGTRALRYGQNNGVGTLVVGVKSGYAQDWLEHRLLNTIRRTLARLAGRGLTVQFEVEET